MRRRPTSPMKRVSPMRSATACRYPTIRHPASQSRLSQSPIGLRAPSAFRWESASQSLSPLRALARE